jgi:hypothetical protein
MPGTIGTIVTIALIVYWLISAILGAVAKKKEQERLQELAMRRRQMAEAAGGEPAGPSATPGPPQTTSQLEDLRRRREAQLADLRQRRAGPPPQPATIQTQAARTAPRPFGRPSPAQARRPAAATPTAPAPAPRPSPPQAPARRPVPVAPGQRVEQRRVDIHTTERPLDYRHIEHREPSIPQPSEPQTAAVAAQVAASAVTARAEFIRVLRQDLSDPDSLRRAFLLKEILDPPVSMRAT